MKRAIKEIFVRSVILANKDMRLKIEDKELILETQYIIEEAQERSLTSQDILKVF
jgi:hypothetical protein